MTVPISLCNMNTYWQFHRSVYFVLWIHLATTFNHPPFRGIIGILEETEVDASDRRNVSEYFTRLESRLSKHNIAISHERWVFGNGIQDCINLTHKNLMNKSILGLVVKLSLNNTSCYIALAAVAYHFAIPVIDISEGPKSPFLRDIPVYEHIGEDEYEEPRAMSEVLKSLALRSVGLVTRDNERKYGFILSSFLSEYDETLPDEEILSNLQIMVTSGNSSTSYNRLCKDMENSEKTVFIIEGDGDFAASIFRYCDKLMNYLKPVVIATQSCVTINSSVNMSYYPVGLIGIRLKKFQDVSFKMQTALEILVNATVNYLFLIRDLDGFNYGNATDILRIPRDLRTHYSELKLKYFINSFKDCIVFNRPYRDPSYCKKRYTSQFDLVNLVADKNKTGKQWVVKGSVVGARVEIESLQWGDDAYFTPLRSQSQGGKHLIVAAGVVEPFTKVSSAGADFSCYVGKECYPFAPNVNLSMVALDVNIPYNTTPRNDEAYFKKIRQCCEGLEIDLLERLSKDMQFEYTLYFGNFPAGYEVNGTWNGLVGGVVRKKVDLAIGSVSITRERAKVVRFTTPYFYSGFAIMVAKKPPKPASFAFIQPMSWEVWLAIFCSLHIISIFKAVFEWLSPYGLNPTALKNNPDPYSASNSVFACPSALTSSYSLLFLHTHPCKLPRSLSARLLTYVWAGIACLVVASYTANLASFMAGRLIHLDLDINKIIKQPQSWKYAAAKGSSAEKYIKEQWSQLAVTLSKNAVSDHVEAKKLLSEDKLDAYFDDAPIIIWDVTTDGDCKLLTVGGTFGDDYYGIVMPKGHEASRMATTISNLIHEYRANSYIDALREEWFMDRKFKCVSADISHSSLGYEHVSGLFSLLGVAIMICFFILILENLLYAYIVRTAPRRRKKRGKSVFTNSLSLFLSQQIHKIIYEEKHINSNNHDRLVQDHKNQSIACPTYAESNKVNKPLSYNNHSPSVQSFISDCRPNIQSSRIRRENSGSENLDIYSTPV